jgi:hypothetical protein
VLQPTQRPFFCMCDGSVLTGAILPIADFSDKARLLFLPRRRDFVSLRALHDDGCFTPLRNEPSLSGLDEARLPMARRNAKKLIGDACRQESPAPIRRQYLLIPKISMVGASRGPHRTQRFANWYRFGNQTAPHNWKANAFERREHRTLDPGKTAKSDVLRGRRSNLPVYPARNPFNGGVPARNLMLGCIELRTYARATSTGKRSQCGCG